MAGVLAAAVADDPRYHKQLGNAMDSRMSTVQLLVVMAATAMFYIVGRWLAEVLRQFAESGALPSL